MDNGNSPTREQLRTQSELTTIWTNREWTLERIRKKTVLVGTLKDNEPDDGLPPVVLVLTSRGRIKPYRLDEGETV